MSSTRNQRYRAPRAPQCVSFHFFKILILKIGHIAFSENIPGLATFFVRSFVHKVLLLRYTTANVKYLTLRHGKALQMQTALEHIEDDDGAKEGELKAAKRFSYKRKSRAGCAVAERESCPRLPLAQIRFRWLYFCFFRTIIILLFCDVVCVLLRLSR